MIFKKPKRKVNKVFIHCSASDHAHHDNIETIRRWHVKENAWSDIGYHYVITKSGAVFLGRSLEKQPAAQRGHNKGSIAICLTGLDHFSDKQKNALYNLCYEIDKQYGGHITFHGHREVDSNKTCPNFEYKTVLRLDLSGYMVALAQPENPPSNLWADIVNFIKQLFK